MAEILARRRVVNASVSKTMQIRNAIHAKMDIMIFQAVLIANAKFMEQNLKFVIKILVTAYVKMAMDLLDVIVAFLDFSTIPIVFLVIVQLLALRHRFAIKMENALALEISPAKDAISVWQDFINSLSAYHVIAIITVQME